MKLTIVGGGYVGLVTAACLSHLNYNTTVIEIFPEKVAAINRAEPPIYEDGLDTLLKTHISANLRATTQYQQHSTPPYRQVMSSSLQLAPRQIRTVLPISRTSPLQRKQSQMNLQNPMRNIRSSLSKVPFLREQPKMSWNPSSGEKILISPLVSA